MKPTKFLKIVALFLTPASFLFSQAPGDIAFIGFNADGDDDFAIVLLTDQTPNSIIYFSDSEPENSTTFASGEGYVAWNTGNNTLKSGTIVLFNDFDSTKSRTVSVGSITDQSGSFNLSASGDALFAYSGTLNTVAVWLAGIQNKAGSVGANFADTTLIMDTTFVNFYSSGSPDAGFYIGNRSSVSLYTNYLELIGNKANWNSSTGNSNGETVLPFSQETFTTNTTSWLGASNGIWNLSENWDNGIPTSNSFVLIPEGITTPVISAGALAGNINIMESDGLTINPGGSLIVSGTSNGNITYKRTLTHDADNSNAWYLVSSPVLGETMSDMRNNNNFVTNGHHEISFATYNNSQATATDRWSYFLNTATDALVDGKGYSAKLAAPGAITFTGTMNTSDVSIPLTQGTGNNGNNFNLLGNPFTAFIDNNTFLTLNTTVLVQEEIYVWNQSTSSFDTKVSGISFKIAPGQAFFVEANSTKNVMFSKNIQSHEASDTFQKKTIPTIKLLMNHNSTSRYTNIYYITAATTSFDNGYDGKLFSGVPNPFTIYTHLISESAGKNYQIQSLPDSNYESMVIPIGVNAASDKELTFTAEVSSLPSELKVFLEDRFTNSFTRLDLINSEYKITLKDTLIGIGRFYLHTAQSILKIKSPLLLDTINIYKTNRNTLRITGLSNRNTKVILFDILGKKMMDTAFQSNGVIDISLPSLAKGMYLIQLENEAIKLNKKLILK